MSQQHRMGGVEAAEGEKNGLVFILHTDVGWKQEITQKRCEGDTSCPRVQNTMAITRLCSLYYIRPA